MLYAYKYSWWIEKMYKPVESQKKVTMLNGRIVELRLN